MRRMNAVYGILLLLALACSPAAWAGANVFYPTGTHTADWNDLANWVEVLADWSGTEPATVLPPVTSGIYLDDTSPEYPMAILAGDTGYADYIYFGVGSTGDPADTWDIYGTLDMIDGIGYDSIFFGNAGKTDPNENNPDPAVLTVHEGAVVNVKMLATFNGSLVHEDYMIQNGGTVNVSPWFICTNLYNFGKNKLNYQLNGGTLYVPLGSLDGSTWVASTNDQLAMDVNGGTLIISSSNFDDLVTNGCILSAGTLVTPENIDTLLLRDYATYRSINCVKVTVGSGTLDPLLGYQAQWTMDDNAADALVLDSTAMYDAVFSDATGNPNTSAHHSADSKEGTGSLTFDGVDDYIVAPDAAVLETGNAITRQLTVSAWIKDASGGAPGFGTVAGTGEGGWLLARDGSTMLAAFWTTAGLRIAGEATDISDGQWHHVVALWNGNRARLFVDGNHGKSGSATGTIQDPNAVGANPVFIGTNPGAAGRLWNGLIDDVKIYEYALNYDDIEALYHAEYPKHAWNPDPYDLTELVDNEVTTILGWSAGDGAVSHNVYFGPMFKGDLNTDFSVDLDDFAIMAGQWLIDGSADIADPNNIVDIADFLVLAEDWAKKTPQFIGNQTELAYDAGFLDSSTNYYWRIDEIDAEDNVWTGRLWMLTTEPNNL